MTHPPSTHINLEKSRALASLDDVLRRNDVWRGHSQAFVSQEVIDTGHEALNKLLLHGGWPQGSLIELGQLRFAGLWFLLSPAVKALMQGMRGAVLALLNPPAEPCAVNLLQTPLALDDVLLIRPQTKSDFVASFVELAKSPACIMLMAWPPKQALSYAELRKCQLATQEQLGLYMLFRHVRALRQSSPAALRLTLQLDIESLHIELLKQRGRKPGASTELALPDSYLSDIEYRDLLEFDNEKDQKSILHFPDEANRTGRE